MKMKRDEFKALIKECLVEIFSENSTKYVTEQKQIRPSQQQRVNSMEFRKKPYDPKLDSRVSSNIIKHAAGGDLVMESLLADTARTTLQEQLANGDGMSPYPAEGLGGKKISQQEQFNGTPEQVFGEDTSSKWAALAFANELPKR
jgi:hypothetical protein